MVISWRRLSCPMDMLGRCSGQCVTHRRFPLLNTVRWLFSCEQWAAAVARKPRRTDGLVEVRSLPQQGRSLQAICSSHPHHYLQFVDICRILGNFRPPSCTTDHLYFETTPTILNLASVNKLATHRTWRTPIRGMSSLPWTPKWRWTFATSRYHTLRTALLPRTLCHLCRAKAAPASIMFATGAT